MEMAVTVGCHPLPIMMVLRRYVENTTNYVEGIYFPLKKRIPKYIIRIACEGYPANNTGHELSEMRTY
jgi:hypothetical protein